MMSSQQQHVGFPIPTQPVAAECVVAEERRRRSLRRRVSNRESARRSRTRKQQHLDELRGSAALLQPRNRDLAARVASARAKLALTLLANAALRTEAAALSGRLAAARRALDLRYDAGLAAHADDAIQQMFPLSLIAEQPYELLLRAADPAGGHSTALISESS